MNGYGLFCGLRKGEIDSLRWDQIDLEQGSVRLEVTRHANLKTEASSGDVPMDAEVVAEMREFIAPNCGEFVLKSHRNPDLNGPRRQYRCRETFRRLIAWLRKKGIDGQKPLHTLRKEIGAQIASTAGIYAASRFLRHSDISTTTRHYADQKVKLTTGLGGLLNTSRKDLDVRTNQGQSAQAASQANSKS